MSCIRLVAFVVACVSIGVTSTFAQSDPAPSALARASGVSLDSASMSPAARPVARDDASIIRADGGRAVIALKGGGILALDHHARVRILDNTNDNFSRIEILEGSAIVVTRNNGPSIACGNNARLSSEGVFRFDVEESGPAGAVACSLRVSDGAAAIPLASMLVALRAGQSMKLDPRCGDMTPVQRISADASDDFDRWSKQQASQ